MDSEWKVDAKSGIQYKDPDNADQCIFYVNYLVTVYSDGHYPKVYWYEWKYLGPFVYQEACKQRKIYGGSITHDRPYENDPNDKWYPCWF